MNDFFCGCYTDTDLFWVVPWLESIKATVNKKKRNAKNENVLRPVGGVLFRLDCLQQGGLRPVL